MQTCKNCGHAVDDGVQFCPACGAPLRPSDPSDRPASPRSGNGIHIANIVLAVISALLIGVIVYLAVNRAPASEPSAAAPTAKSSVVSRVAFERKTDSLQKEYAVISAYSDREDLLWTRETEHYDVGDRSKLDEITLLDDAYYYYEGGKLFSIDPLTGDELWKTEVCDETLGDWVIDDEGSIYITGYEGPDLCIVDPQGNVTARYDSLQDGFESPYDIRLTDNGDVVISYEITPSGDKGSLTIDPADGKVLQAVGDKEPEPSPTPTPTPTPTPEPTPAPVVQRSVDDYTRICRNFYLSNSGGYFTPEDKFMLQGGNVDEQGRVTYYSYYSYVWPDGRSAYHTTGDTIVFDPAADAMYVNETRYSISAYDY